MNKRIAVGIAVIIALLAGYYTYLYLNPDIAFIIVRGREDREAKFDHYTLYYSEHSVLPIPGGFMAVPISDEIKDNMLVLSEGTKETESEIMNMTPPFDISLEITFEDGNTIFTYDGTYTEKGQQKEYHKVLTFDFIFTEEVEIQ